MPQVGKHARGNKSARNTGKTTKTTKPAPAITPAPPAIDQPAPEAPALTPAIQDTPAITPEVVTEAPANDTPGMAMLKFTAYQDGDTFTGVELETVITDTTARAVIGNVLNSLYGWVRLQRRFKTGAFKWNKPINVRFTIGGNVWDTGAMAATYKQRLKLTDTPESRANFAGCFYELYKVTTAKVTPVTFDEFYNGLLSESEDAKAARAAKIAAKTAATQAAA